MVHPLYPLNRVDFEPLDGGIAVWIQVPATHLLNSLAWGYAATFGVYQLYYVQPLNLPSAQISWIGRGPGPPQLCPSASCQAGSTTPVTRARM